MNRYDATRQVVERSLPHASRHANGSRTNKMPPPCHHHHYYHLHHHHHAYTSLPIPYSLHSVLQPSSPWIVAAFWLEPALYVSSSSFPRDIASARPAEDEASCATTEILMIYARTALSEALGSGDESKHRSQCASGHTDDEAPLPVAEPMGATSLGRQPLVPASLWGHSVDGPQLPMYTTETSHERPLQDATLLTFDLDGHTPTRPRRPTFIYCVPAAVEALPCTPYPGHLDSPALQIFC